MNKILEIDVENYCAVVEPGVYNHDLQKTLKPSGYFYAPFSAKQRNSTIGGNIGVNSGRTYCIKFGRTNNHILGLEIVTASGEIVFLGGKSEQMPGYDLISLITGSEGTLGLITKAIVRITPLPKSEKTILVLFNNLDHAVKATTELISHGSILSTFEMMDNPTLEMVEKSEPFDSSETTETILTITVSGAESEITEQQQKLFNICKNYGAKKIETANNEKQNLEQKRHTSFVSLNSLSPSKIIADGMLPLSKLPAVLKNVTTICQKYNLEFGHFLYTGNGNLQLFRVNGKDIQKEKLTKAKEEIYQTFIETEGTICGEFGIGLEKKFVMKKLFTQNDLDAMKKIKQVFDQQNLFNPNKIFPVTEVDNI